jgi:hypothetical protein
MKLRYRNTIEDLIAFNAFLYSKSPMLTRQALHPAVAIFVLGCLVISVGALDWTWTDRVAANVFSVLNYLVLDILIATAFYVFVRLLMARQLRRNVCKMYQQKPDKIALGERELEIVDGKLVERTPFSTTYWELSGIEQIVSAPQHVFVFTSAWQAYILPRVTLAEGEMQEFVGHLERRRTESATSFPPATPSEAIRADRASIQRS